MIDESTCIDSIKNEILTKLTNEETKSSSSHLILLDNFCYYNNESNSNIDLLSKLIDLKQKLKFEFLKKFIIFFCFHFLFNFF